MSREQGFLSRFCTLLFGLSICLGGPAMAADSSAKKPVNLSMVGQSILEMPLADGVGMDDAVESMKLRANQLNFKLVAELPLSKQVEAMTGKPQRLMAIYQFCDALTAKQMLEHNFAFAAFLPCRIALIEDDQGKGRLIMLNLDNMIQAAQLPPELQASAVGIRNNLLSIMIAGANGEL